MAANIDIIDTEYEQYLDDDERVLWNVRARIYSPIRGSLYSIAPHTRS